MENDFKAENNEEKTKINVINVKDTLSENYGKNEKIKSEILNNQTINKLDNKYRNNENKENGLKICGKLCSSEILVKKLKVSKVYKDGGNDNFDCLNSVKKFKKKNIKREKENIESIDMKDKNFDKNMNELQVLPSPMLENNVEQEDEVKKNSKKKIGINQKLNIDDWLNSLDKSTNTETDEKITKQLKAILRRKINSSVKKGNIEEATCLLSKLGEIESKEKEKNELNTKNVELKSEKLKKYWKGLSVKKNTQQINKIVFINN